MTAREGPLALALAALALLASGCGVEFGSDTTTIHKDDEITNVEDFLSQQLPDLPPTKSVDCPGDVEAKVGETFKCTATLSNGQKVVVPLRINTVNGDKGTMSSDPAIVDQALAVDLLYKAAQSPPKLVDCPTGIPANVGKTFICKAALQDGTTSAVKIRVVSAPSNGIQHLTIVAAKKAN